MKNLAGVRNCDLTIRAELEEARVPILDIGATSGGEVPFSLIGLLPSPTRPHGSTIGDPFAFRLTRAWYYWVAKGRVPLDVAHVLYEHPIGRKDVRVAGHCGCPPPEAPWISYVAADGRNVLLLNEDDQALFAQLDRHELDGTLAKVLAGMRVEHHLVTTEEERAKLATFGFIDSYHIDSQEGLNLFVTTLREFGVVV